MPAEHKVHAPCACSRTFFHPVSHGAYNSAELSRCNEVGRGHGLHIFRGVIRALSHRHGCAAYPTFQTITRPRASEAWAELDAAGESAQESAKALPSRAARATQRMKESRTSCGPDAGKLG